MAIANRAKSTIFKGLGVFVELPPNLFDLAFKMKKIKSKQKALATGTDGNKKVSLPPYLP